MLLFSRISSTSQRLITSSISCIFPPNPSIFLRLPRGVVEAKGAFTQIKKRLQILLQKLNTLQTIINDPLPPLQLQPRIRPIREQQRIVRIAHNGLRIQALGALVVALLEARIALHLQLVGLVLVAWHGGRASNRETP